MEVGLQQLLQNDTLVVVRYVVSSPCLDIGLISDVRQIEMMNIFMGFEQANRYALTDALGNHVG